MKHKRRTAAPESIVISSNDGALSLVLVPSSHGICLTRRHVKAGCQTEHSVVLSSPEAFERIHSNDPLRFEHQHVYARAKSVLEEILR